MQILMQHHLCINHLCIFAVCFALVRSWATARRCERLLTVCTNAVTGCPAGTTMRFIISFRRAVASFTSSIWLTLCGSLLHIFPLLSLRSFPAELLFSLHKFHAIKSGHYASIFGSTTPFAVIMASSRWTLVRYSFYIFANSLSSSATEKRTVANIARRITDNNCSELNGHIAAHRTEDRMFFIVEYSKQASLMKKQKSKMYNCLLRDLQLKLL